MATFNIDMALIVYYFKIQNDFVYDLAIKIAQK